MMHEALDDCELGVRINGEYYKAVEFADDQAVIAGSARSLQTMVNRINKKAKSYGMKINVAKTKVMSVANEPRPFTLKIDEAQVEQVDSFRYLGQLLTNDVRCEKQVITRIAKWTFRRNDGILCARNTNINLRKRIMKAYVWSIVTYGAETWTLNKKMEQKLEAFEMWCYRRMQRISWTEHVTNNEVLVQVHEERSLLKTIQRRALSYLGHVLRHDGLVPKILEGRLEGKRRRSRPRNNFVAQACKRASLETFGHLKEAALDRHKWRAIQRQL